MRATISTAIAFAIAVIAMLMPNNSQAAFGVTKKDPFTIYKKKIKNYEEKLKEVPQKFRNLKGQDLKRMEDDYKQRIRKEQDKLDKKLERMKEDVEKDIDKLEKQLAARTDFLNEKGEKPDEDPQCKRYNKDLEEKYQELENLDKWAYPVDEPKEEKKEE